MKSNSPIGNFRLLGTAKMHELSPASQIGVPFFVSFDYDSGKGEWGRCFLLTFLLEEHPTNTSLFYIWGHYMLSNV